MWRYANPVTIHWTSDVSQLLLNLLPPGQGVLFAYPQFQEPFAASLLGGPLNGVPVFNGIESNPTPDQVQLAIDFALAIAPRWILAIGGGSVLDTAKLVRLALAGGCQRIDELLETVPGEPLAPSPLLVAIPTTHGTGAELTMWTTVWDKGGGRKLSLSHPNNYPDIAIYSPALTYSLPLPLSFTTTLDALSHALEALWNRNGNPVSDELASAAVQLVSENLERLADPVPHPVRANLLRASLLRRPGLLQYQDRRRSFHLLPPYAATGHPPRHRLRHVSRSAVAHQFTGNAGSRQSACACCWAVKT